MLFSSYFNAMKRRIFAFVAIAFVLLVAGFSLFASAYSSSCYSDVNYDGIVNDADQGPLRENFGKSSSQNSCSWNLNTGIVCKAFDANRDGVVDERDNAALGYDYGSSCSPVSFYDYNDDFYVSNPDLVAVEGNAGKNSSENCVVGGETVSCSLLDGNKDGIVNVEDEYGVLVNWKAFVGARPDSTLSGLAVGYLPFEAFQLERVNVTVRNSKNVGFGVFDSSRNPAEKIFVWFDGDGVFWDEQDQAEFQSCMQTNGCARMVLIPKNSGAWNANGESRVSFDWIPMKSGNYPVYVYADDYPEFGEPYGREVSENNNIAAMNVSVGITKPDLVAQSIRVLQSPSIWKKVRVEVNVSNANNASIPASTRNVFVRLKDANTVVEEVNVSKNAGVWLAWGKNSFVFDWTPQSGGLRNLTLEVDDVPNANGVEESESNNVLNLSVNVDRPDLAVQSISTPTLRILQPSTINITIANLRNAPFPSNTTNIFVVLTRDIFTLNQSDARFIGIKNVSKSEGLWNGSASALVQFDWTPSVGGSHSLKAFVSDEPNIAGLEESEGNNNRSQNVFVNVPDLAVDEISFPTQPDINHAGQVVVVVKNLGNAPFPNGTFSVISVVLNETHFEYYTPANESGFWTEPVTLGTFEIQPGEGAWNALGNSTVVFNWTPPEEFFGESDFSVFANANPFQQGFEPDYSNNNLTAAGTPVLYTDACIVWDYSGNPETKLDVALFGDGMNYSYDEQEWHYRQASFDNDSNFSLTGLSLIEPLHSQEQKINFLRFSRMGDYCEANWRFCSGGSGDWTAAVLSCPADLRGVLTTNNIGGNGGMAYPMFFMVTTRFEYDRWETAAVVHEFGHALSWLKDEWPGNTEGMPSCAPNSSTAMEWWGDLVGGGKGALKILSEPELDYLHSESSEQPLDDDYWHCIYGDVSCVNYTRILSYTPPGCTDGESGARPTVRSMMSSGGDWFSFVLFHYYLDFSPVLFWSPGFVTDSDYAWRDAFGKVNQRSLNQSLEGFS